MPQPPTAQEQQQQLPLKHSEDHQTAKHYGSVQTSSRKQTKPQSFFTSLFVDPVKNNFNLEDAVTSSYISPTALFFVRCILTMYAVIVWLADAVVPAIVDGDNRVIYFTNLSYFGLMVYLIISTFLSYRYLKNADSPSYGVGFRWFYWHLFPLAVSFHIVTPVMFWTVLKDSLADAGTYRTWTSISMHALDFVLMFTDAMLCRTRISWTQLPLTLVLGSLYMPLAQVYHASTGMWVYPFLNPEVFPYQVGLFFGMLALSFAAFAIGRYASRLRRSEYPFKKDTPIV